MSSRRCLLVVLAAVLAVNVLAQTQTPVTLTAPNAPPDVMGLFSGPAYVGSVNAMGDFSFQGVSSVSQAATGAYLSHTCNPDGTFDAVWSVTTYTPTGAVATSTPYCEHGAVKGSSYTSLYQAGTLCPIPAPYTGTTNRTIPQLPGSNVGMLSTSPFCNPNLDPSLMHITANTPAPAPTTLISNPGPGTVSVDQGSAGAPGAGGATSSP